MKKLILVFIAILMVGQLSYAGDVTAMTNEGDKALTFQFKGLSTLGADPVWCFGNYNAIGMKYYIASDMAIRPALLFGLNSKTTNGTTGMTDRKESDMGIGLTASLQYNMVKSGAFVGYVGGGLNFLSISTSTEPSVATGTTSKTTTSKMNFGLGGSAGFEYFIYDHISLGAEYVLGLTIGSGSTDVTSGTTTTTTDDPSTLGVGFSTFSFTLAAYW